MKLEVGKCYRNRKGKLVAILSFHKEDYFYPFHSRYGRYMENGRNFTDYQTDDDLVEEVVIEEVDVPLELKVNGTYRTRDGRVVTIVRFDEIGCYPCIADNKDKYKFDGKYYDYGYHDNDLVEELQLVPVPMFDNTWAFNNLNQIEEETKMQDQIVAINCTLVVRDIEGTLTLQVHPKDEFWRADATTTVLDSNFELVLPKAKVEELYTERLLAKVQKADQDYKEALEAFDTAKDFLDNL